jgi:phosphoribosylformylglycinamidine cyclo-ligase
MDSDQAVSVVEGVAAGCREAGCVLFSGETASMPGFYSAGEYDLAGCIVGVVERQHLVTGAAITAGDAVIGFPSLGLHTNGYSLARYVLGLDHLDHLDRFEPLLGRTIGEELLLPHQNYESRIRPLLEAGLVTGMAHITGGGIPGNVPRIVPPGLRVVLDAATWDILPIFHLIQRQGHVPWAEMVRVFNLGIGYIVFCHEADVTSALSMATQYQARVIGHIDVLQSHDDPAEVVVIEGLT